MKLSNDEARTIGANKNVFAIYAWRDGMSTKEFYTTYAEACAAAGSIKKYDMTNGTKTNYCIINGGEKWIDNNTRHY